MGIEIEPPVRLGSQIFRKGPIRRKIEELRERWRRGSSLSTQAILLPPGVTREEAIATVAASSWAQGLAAGWLARFFPELKPRTPEYERKKNEIARIVAERMLFR
jgi:hypothetical protein